MIDTNAEVASPTLEKIKQITGLLMSRKEEAIIKMLCLEIDELKRRVEYQEDCSNYLYEVDE